MIMREAMRGPEVSPYMMRSLQNSPVSLEGTAPADIASISIEQAPTLVKPDWVRLVKMQEAPVQDKNAVPLAEIGHKAITRKTDTSTMDIEYPQVMGDLSEDAKAGINGTLQSFVTDKAAFFEEDASQVPIGEGLSSSMDMGFTTVAVNDRFISFTAGSSSYVAGWAHPSNELATFNFDASTGRSLTFNDLFKVSEEEIDQSFLFRDNLKARQERERFVLNAVSSYCIDDLKKQNEGRPDDEKIDESLIGDVAAPEEGKFDLFVLTDRGLTINFFYCHAAGYGEVTLPYEALADIIDPESVIGHHARKDEKKSPDEVSPPEIVVEDDMIIIDTIKLDVKK